MQFSDCLHDSFLRMTIPEIIAVITGVLSVWFARKESILVYPIGIISVLLYVYICLHVKLYADAAVNGYYFLASVYGWYYWKHGGRYQSRVDHNKELDSFIIEEDEKPHEEAMITKYSIYNNMLIAAVTILIGAGLGFALDNYTDSTVPYWDGITTGIFITAMWLMAKKKIENWIYWVVGDAVCIPLFLSKGLCLSSLQYVIFTVLAIVGYLSWFSKLHKKSNPAT